MSALRALVAFLAVCVAVVLQVSVFPHLAWQGVVPNLCLLVVVAAALTRGSHFAAVLGFVAGVSLDLAPPADHIAGRWALALVIVGYVAGRVRRDSPPTATTVVATVAAATFVGTSVFALTGMVLDDLALGVPDLLRLIGASVVMDLLLTPFVLPPLMAMVRKLEPDRALA